jgi:hypothetical protein
MTDTPPPPDAALRRDLRELGDVLGATITRQEGRAVFDLVERVRGLVRTDRTAAATLLAGVDPVTATKLVRAFTTFFHLARGAGRRPPTRPGARPGAAAHGQRDRRGPAQHGLRAAGPGAGGARGGSERRGRRNGRGAPRSRSAAEERNLPRMPAG